MLKSSFTVGLTAGIFGIITSICGGCVSICGSITGNIFAQNPTGNYSGVTAGFYIGVILILLSLAGVVGAAMVQKKKIAGAILMGCYPIIGLISVITIGMSDLNNTGFSGEIGIISFVIPAILFTVSSVLGFNGKIKDNQ